MIATDPVEIARIAKARQQPCLSYLSFSLLGTLTAVRREFFPNLPYDVSASFVTDGPLACICSSEATASIYIHQLLNHSETPLEVISLICKHELLHLTIPSAIEGGKLKQHPAAFWEAERAIAPERRAVWPWIYVNLDSYLRHRPRLERVDVQRRWKKVWSQPKQGIADCLEALGTGCEQVEAFGW